MYLKKKRVQEIVPPHVLNARGNIIWSMMCLGSFLGIVGLGIYQYAVNRGREAAAARRLMGPRIVVIGGNTAGANAAAALTQYHPDVQVKVLEPQKEQVYYGCVPLAAAGHRSYDLRCSGPNTLYASITWTITRDAELIVAAAEKIEPEKNQVIDSNGVVHPYDVLVLACGAPSGF
jgi:NADPH-dependent 2,4-dienoyl-CoA reductase/sulfur reductase-like enzyme